MWNYVIMLALALVATYVMRPKSQTTPPKGLDEVTAPTAEVGREIPVLFGRRAIYGANVVWYGDLATSAVKTKGGGGGGKK